MLPGIILPPDAVRFSGEPDEPSVPEGGESLQNI